MTRKSDTIAGMGQVREAILRELVRQERTRYWLWKQSGVPKTTLYDFLDGETAGIADVEKMMAAIGLTVAHHLQVKSATPAARRRKARR